MIDAAHHFITTEHRLHQGLKNGEFVPYYQPIVDLRNQQVCALEALVRWNHPERGLTGPDEFLPVAEATGQISQLGEYLFERIVDDLRGWEIAGLRLPIAVNLSIREFADPGLCKRLMDRLSAANCSVGLVRLEITEQVFIGDLDLARRRLQCFRESGFCIALDDFGSGYSSFNYLKHLPIDSLKIDRAFVVDLATQARSRAILRAIAGVCRELDLDAVVEGVETDAQRQALVDMNFQTAQGFVFHRPQPAQEISRLLLGAEATAAAAPLTLPARA
jgi:EAL domain-containing protein (putative c-di-GMP-specific phosphodiesterase class I)